jgi:outer membrane protein insertion porin family
VFLKASDLDLGEIRGTLGLGVRYRSPVGPIRVDIGFKLDRETTSSGTRERGYVVHLGLGQAF